MSSKPLLDLLLLDRIRLGSQRPVAHTRASALPRKVHADLELILALELPVVGGIQNADIIIQLRDVSMGFIAMCPENGNFEERKNCSP
jgi:hypothetical protein